MKGPALAAAASVLLAGRAAAEPPIVRAQLLGGQYLYGGDRGALSGNAAISIVPAAQLTETVRLVPVISSSYQGTKQVVDLVGAGTLLQEQMEHRIAVRALIDRPGSRWRLKPNAGYTHELLKETRDETWGGGLFDTRRLSGGLEAEYLYREPYSIRLAFDYVYAAFPNYNSLESQVGFGLARELAGRRVLDHHAQSVLVAASVPVGRLVVEGQLREQRSSFLDQHLVDSTGALGKETREDYLTSLGLALRMPAELNTDLRLLGTLELGAAFNGSDQSSFDAARARYLPRFYGYREARVGSGGQLLFGDPREPIVLSGAVSWTRRVYPNRPPQDATGLYQGGSLRQDHWLLSTTFSYPLAPRFSLVASLQHGTASSNQGFELGYSYKYAVTNYLFGVSYEY